MITIHPSIKSVPMARHLAALLLVFGVTTAGLASTGSSSSSTPTTSAYIEHPQPTVTVTSTYSSYPYSSNYGSSTWYGPSYYSTWPSLYNSSTTTFRPRRYFFPPNPPALGEIYIRSRTKSSSLRRSSIPISLSDIVNEPFYAPLSPFLYEEHVSKRRQKMIDDYRTAKQALVEELRARIASLRDADPATREAQLATFAQVQTPRVIAVEKIAYDIRDELTHWSLFSSSSDWNEGRDWRLGDDTRWESTLDDAKLMRGAAFFQDGLSPAQRRLLREYAMELDDSGRPPTTDIGLDVRGPYFYFSPETSRIRLPGDLPSDLEAKIATYRLQKNDLKKELRDILYREDRRWLDSRRTAALRDLAAKQAAQIAALEPLAEEIRRGLAPLPNPSKPRPPAQVLPKELAERVTAFMDRKNEYQKALNARMAELKRRFPTSRVEYVRMRDAYGIQLVGHRKLRDSEKAELARAQATLDDFNDEQIQVFLSLVREKDAIRESLIQSAGGLAPLVTARMVDLILREYTNILAVQEWWRLYSDYEAAVLQPGLSPEQRRMLYDAALVKLDQQIPHYTY